MKRERCAVFSTSLGWVAAAWTGRGLSALTFGHPSPREALRRLPEVFWESGAPDPDSTAADPLIDRLCAYADGHPDDFRDVRVDLCKATEFQRRVLQGCRRIPYGRTISYAQLAARAGSPRAARAVGNTMAKNRIPLIIPCHRVVGSGDSLGGYSAPDGLQMKRRLLDLEGVREPSTVPA